VAVGVDTVIVHIFETESDPSVAVAQIKAVPSVTPAVTKPFASTVAAVVLPDVQVTFWFEASVGVIVAVSCSVDPVSIVVPDLFRVIPVTYVLTVTVQTAGIAPSSVVTVMVAAPSATPVTSPDELTVLLLHLYYLKTRKYFDL